jgi:hypothetical protein
MEHFDLVLFDLLVKHDCVIIPDFGGFVSKRVSSKIDFDKGLIIPPSKHLLFNRHLTNNDGLLLAAYAERHGVSYIDAEQRLNTLIKKFQKELAEEREISFPKIGVLRRSPEGYYTFSQDKSFNMLSDAYGLKDLEFVAVEEEVETQIEQNEQIPSVIEMEKKPVKVKKRVSKQLLRYAAVACLLPIMLYTFWIPFKSDFFNSGLISFSDFNPFYNKEVGAYQPSSEAYEVDKKLTKVEAIESDLQESIVPKTEDLKITEDVSLQQNKVVPSEIKVKATPYFKQFIVGCFSVEQNAINFKNKITEDGFSPRILSGGRLHRVSMGMTYSADEFNNLMALARKNGYSGWTLKQ